MNTIGIVVALATFLGVWVGHVAVRKIEFVSATVSLPTGIFILLGTGLEYLSLRNADSHWSAAFGIFGITVLWDALEIIRQQGRIKKGHAPANPNNPRHVRILAAYSSATLDPPKRDPVGHPLLTDDVVRLVDKRS